MLCCAVLCCAVLCCAVLCCAVLRCAALCCAVLHPSQCAFMLHFVPTLQVIGKRIKMQGYIVMDYYPTLGAQFRKEMAQVSLCCLHCLVHSVVLPHLWNCCCSEVITATILHPL